MSHRRNHITKQIISLDRETSLVSIFHGACQLHVREGNDGTLHIPHIKIPHIKIKPRPNPFLHQIYFY